MKKFYVILFNIYFFFSSILVFSQSTPEIVLGDLGTTSFCPGGTLSIPYTTTLPSNIFIGVRLSDQSGNFGFYSTLLGGGYVSPISVSIPSGMSAGTGYRIRLEGIAFVSNISVALTSTGQVLAISVKNLVGKEIETGYNVCQGSALTGLINSNQTAGVSYQWKKDGVVISNSPSFRITQTGNYIASVQKLGCNNAQRFLNITFNQPYNHYVERVGNEYQCSNVSIIFREKYFSDSARFQWTKDNVILAGETKDTLVTNQTGIFKAIVTDKCYVPEGRGFTGDKVVFSNSIQNNINTYPSKKANVLCGSSIFGSAFSSTTEFKNLLAAYTYQWKKNGIDIVNANSNWSPIIQDEGVYSLALSQGNCTSISEGIVFIRKDTLKLDLNIERYSDKKLCTGAISLLEYYGHYGITTSIYKDTSLYLSNTPVLTQFYVNSTGKYTIRGSAADCIILPSDTVSIVFGNNFETKIYHPQDYFCNGGGVTLSINTSSYLGSNITYRWYRNNVLIPPSSYYGTSISASQPGIYKVQITSSSCTGVTDSVEIKNIQSLPKPKIYSKKGDLMDSILERFVCNNNVIELHAKDYFTSDRIIYDFVYWKKNGQAVLRKENDAEPFYVSQAGSYSLVGEKGVCQIESDPIEIKYGDPITGNISGTSSIYSGEKAMINLNFTGGNAWSYRTSDMATNQNTMMTSLIKNVTPTTTQTYSITSLASNCGIGTTSGNAIVTVLPCPIGNTISIKSGNWNQPSTWSCGQIPTSLNDATIENGHIITVPNNYQGQVKKLRLKGMLIQQNGSGFKVNN